MGWSGRGAAIVGTVALGMFLAGCAQPRWQSQLVSLNGAGSDSATSGSGTPSVSLDGTKVAFMSEGSDFGPTDSPRQSNMDVYMRDLETGVTTLVSGNAAGTDRANGASFLPVFSPDGTKIAFLSHGSDFGPADTSEGPGDIYVKDLSTGTFTLASANNTGTSGGNAGAGAPVFSPDGTKLAFDSLSTDLGPTDTTMPWGYLGSDIYVRDLVTGVTSLVSVNGEGTNSGYGDSRYPVFSPDGTKVAFRSNADDLGPANTNGRDGHDVYVRDLVAQTTVLVSANPDGTNGGNRGFSDEPAFSPDSTKVAFFSAASNLVAGDANGMGDVFLRDLDAGVTTQVSITETGTSPNAGSSQPVFSPDGTKLAFNSSASDLGPSDANQHIDVYLRDLARGETSLVSAVPDGTNGGNGDSGSLFGSVRFSPSGGRVVFASRASDLGPIDDNGTQIDVYVRDLNTGTVSLVSMNAAGTGSGNEASGGRQGFVSEDKVFFTSSASNISSTDTNERVDVFVATLRQP